MKRGWMDCEAAAPVARGYQRALFEEACERNTVAFLPTGSGKTLIASLLVNHYANAVSVRAQEAAASANVSPLAQSAREVGAPQLHIIFTAPTKLLVKQQLAVLAATCPLRLAELTADVGVDFWSHKQWSDSLAGADVLVATPEVVRAALSKAFLSLEQVALLVLDECHHCVKNHPMAQIMNVFYARLVESGAPRPRILGLTASPINGKAAGGAAGRAGGVAELERALFASVVTAEDWEEVEEHAPRAAPRIERYAEAEGEGCPGPGGGAVARARSLFTEARAQLGLWGAACALRHALARRERAFRLQLGGAGVEDGVDDAAMAELCAPPLVLQRAGSAAEDESPQAAALAAELQECALRAGAADEPVDPQLVKQYDSSFASAAASLERMAAAGARQSAHLLAQPRAPWLSDKLRALLSVLANSLAAAPQPSAWRALVFVQRRALAAALATLLASPGAPPGLRPGQQVGYAGGDGAAQRAAAAALAAFRTGALNVLVATSVLEEGVDVPLCSLVVLFDVTRNVRAFVQQRGRARAARSALVVLAPSGGGAEALLGDVAAAEAEMLAAARARRAAGAPDAGEEEETDWLARARGDASYVVARTGATVTLADAVPLLHHYCARLPRAAYCAAPQPLFSPSRDAGGAFRCSVTLPGSLFFGGASSGPQGSKKAAQAACALAAVAALHRAGALDDHLVPLEGAAEAAESDEEEVEVVAEAEEAGCFTPQVKAADVLAGSEPGAPMEGDWLVYELLPADGADPCADEYEEARLGLLLRRPLPPLPPLQLLSAADGRREARRVVPICSLALAPEQAALLAAFTAFVQSRFFDSFPGAGALSPLLLPLLPGGAAGVDWAAAAAAADGWAADQAASPVGRLLVASYSGEEKLFYGMRERADVASDSPLCPKSAQTLEGHYSARYGVAGLQGARWLECVAARLRPRKLLPQGGAAAAAARSGRPRLLLPSLLLRPLRLSAALHRALNSAPARLWRLRALLLASELASRLFPGAPPPPDLCLAVHEAITSGAAAEECSYQRYECVGDSWLKLASSQRLFLALPGAHEGLLSAARSRIVSNAALRRAARAAGLQRYLRSHAFLQPRPTALAPKALADVAEALLGVACTLRSEEAAWAVAVALGVLSLPPPLAEYAAALAALCKGAREAAAAAGADAPPLRCDDASCASLLALERGLGYAFVGGPGAKGREGRLSLLDEALSHASASVGARALAPSLERLEFLGDAALDYLVTRALAEARSDDSPGLLTRLRSAALCNQRLGARAASLRLAAHLRHGSMALQRDVVAYSSERAGGGAFGDGAHAAPKALADCAEAVCGAVFLDSGLRLEALWAVARPLLALDEAALGEKERQHPVARLLELCAARRLVCEFERMPADAGARVGVRIGGCLVAQAAAESARAARLAAAVACLGVADDGVAAAERALQAELEAVIE